jgi:hypothetical protein
MRRFFRGGQPRFSDCLSALSALTCSRAACCSFSAAAWVLALFIFIKRGKAGAEAFIFSFGLLKLRR